MRCEWGATDLREVLGDASAALVKKRGRWASDVAEVYQRALLGRSSMGRPRLGPRVGRISRRVCGLVSAAGVLNVAQRAGSVCV